MPGKYDVIVVGARCAGSPTAMLLAREGHRVLVVDRATFPSDTVSTHVLHAPAVAALRRWGLVDEVVATGCPAIDRYAFDFGPITISGQQLPAVDGGRLAYAPRRTVLDEILVHAASRAGAEVRTGFSVDEVLIEDDTVVGIRGHDEGGRSVVEHARVIVGADGRTSRVAKAVRPEQYHEKPELECIAYSYWSGLPTDGFEILIRGDRGIALIPTNDGLTLVLVGWPIAQAATLKADVEAGYWNTIQLDASLADRMRAATREERFSIGSVPNYFRKPFGPGWVLVGDAGYNKDPITAQGIADAFHDAERCAAALHETFSGTRSFDDAMQDAHHARDVNALPMYEFTTQLATLDPPPPEIQQLLGAIHGHQPAMDEFISINAGTLSPAVFFNPDHIAQLLSPVAIQS